MSDPQTLSQELHTMASYCRTHGKTKVSREIVSEVYDDAARMAEKHETAAQKRIEALEAALRAILDWNDPCTYDYNVLETRRIAEAAMKGQDA